MDVFLLTLRLTLPPEIFVRVLVFAKVVFTFFLLTGLFFTLDEAVFGCAFRRDPLAFSGAMDVGFTVAPTLALTTELVLLAFLIVLLFTVPAFLLILLDSVAEAASFVLVRIFFLVFVLVPTVIVIP